MKKKNFFSVKCAKGESLTVPFAQIQFQMVHPQGMERESPVREVLERANAISREFICFEHLVGLLDVIEQYLDGEGENK